MERLLHLVKRASCKQEPREFAPLLGSHLAHQIKKAVHSQVSTSCGSRFCRRGGVFIKIGLDLLSQLQPGLVLGVGVGVHQHTCGGVAGVALDGFEVAAGLQELIGRAGMPLRYNYDKPEKPRRIKGFEVFSLIFSSFSKPKNHTEISRIAGGVSLTTNE